MKIFGLIALILWRFPISYYRQNKEMEARILKYYGEEHEAQYVPQVLGKGVKV